MLSESWDISVQWQEAAGSEESAVNQDPLLSSETRAGEVKAQMNDHPNTLKRHDENLLAKEEEQEDEEEEEDLIQVGASGRRRRRRRRHSHSPHSHSPHSHNPHSHSPHGHNNNNDCTLPAAPSCSCASLTSANAVQNCATNSECMENLVASSDLDCSDCTIPHQDAVGACDCCWELMKAQSFYGQLSSLQKSVIDDEYDNVMDKCAEGIQSSCNEQNTQLLMNKNNATGQSVDGISTNVNAKTDDLIALMASEGRSKANVGDGEGLFAGITAATSSHAGNGWACS